MAELPHRAGDDGRGKQVREILRRIREVTGGEGVEGAAPAEAVADVGRALRAVTGEHGELELVISTNRISCGDDVVYKSEARDNNLAFELFRQGLRRITFKPGVGDDEIETFVRRFGECRNTEAVDEDFVSTLWKESLPNVQYVALDGFTEKIFMADEGFLAAFRGVLEDVAPGLVDLPEEDEPDPRPRGRSTRDAGERIEAALGGGGALARASTALPSQGPALRARLRATAEPVPVAEHVLRLLCCVAVKHPSPLGPDELGDAAESVLGSLLALGETQAFADAARTLLVLGSARDAFPPEVGPALAALRRASAGRETLGALARGFDPERTEFTGWARYHFVTAGEVAAPDLLALVNLMGQQGHPPGVELLKDLLRRQGTASLEPWAERLRDDNPRVVLEVLDVILGSALGAQAQPLLIETLRHKSPEVRSRAVEGLGTSYSQTVRQSLLPLLRDPSPLVRRAVVDRFGEAADPSVATYLAATIRAPLFLDFDEDEQRLFFEVLATLGGEKFLPVFRERMALEETGGALGKLLKRGSNALADDSIRRGALSGLALLGTPQAIALIREVQARADLELASHCEVAHRLAVRSGGHKPAVRSAPPVEEAPEADTVAAGRTLMGERMLFEPAALQVEPPQRPRPAPEPVAPAPAAASGPATRPVEGALPAKQQPAGAPPPLREARSIGDLPLLAPSEVFLAQDERRLKAEPAACQGPRFTLSGLRAALVGVEAAAERPRLAPAQTPALPRIPARVVERTSRPVVHADWSHQPEASLEDILSSYLEDEASPPSPPPRPPTRPAATARPADEPGGTPAPAAPRPAPVAAPKQNVDELLKEFLDLDLGD